MIHIMKTLTCWVRSTSQNLLILRFQPYTFFNYAPSFTKADFSQNNTNSSSQWICIKNLPLASIILGITKTNVDNSDKSLLLQSLNYRMEIQVGNAQAHKYIKQITSHSIHYDGHEQWCEREWLVRAGYCLMGWYWEEIGKPRKG